MLKVLQAKSEGKKSGVHKVDSQLNQKNPYSYHRFPSGTVYTLGSTNVLYCTFATPTTSAIVALPAVEQYWIGL